jgi:hypothetical protein
MIDFRTKLPRVAASVNNVLFFYRRNMNTSLKLLQYPVCVSVLAKTKADPLQAMKALGEREEV